MRNEAILKRTKFHLKSREEPESRRFSGGTMWFCHFNRGRTTSFPDKSANSGSALPLKFSFFQKITNEGILTNLLRRVLIPIYREPGADRTIKQTNGANVFKFYYS